MSDLKRCPFCGGEAEKCAKQTNRGNFVFIVCENCTASSPIFKIRNPRVKDSENPSIKAWNTRTAPLPKP